MSLRYGTLHLQLLYIWVVGHAQLVSLVTSYVLLYTKVVTLRRVSGYYHNITLWFTSVPNVIIMSLFVFLIIL